MKTKIILTCSAFGLSILGMVAIQNSTINMLYVAASSLIFAAAGVGGIKNYYSPVNRDVRDFLEDLREKNKDLKARINRLEETVIQKEKEIYSIYASTIKSSSRNCEVLIASRTDE
jgi:hypothetical protein